MSFGRPVSKVSRDVVCLSREAESALRSRLTSALTNSKPRHT